MTRKPPETFNQPVDPITGAPTNAPVDLPNEQDLARAKSVMKGKRKRKSYAQRLIDRSKPKPVECFWLRDDPTMGAI